MLRMVARKTDAILFLAAALFCGGLSAAPFAEWFDVKSPKGASVRVWGEGDEFAASFEAEDGHAVLFDAARRAYVYARKDAATGALGPTGIAVGDETEAEKVALADIPLHLRDTSATAEDALRRRVAEDEETFGTQRRWGELKARYQRRRDGAKAGGSASLMAASLSATTLGEVVGLTLLVDFPITDQYGVVTNTLARTYHPDVTKDKLDQLLNGENCTLWGNVSSVRKYYEDASCGRFRYTNIVLGWFTAKYPREHYDDPTKSNGPSARELIGEVFDQMRSDPDYATKYLPVLQRVSYSGSDFRALNVFFAGPSASVWSKGLWAHKWSLVSEQYSKLPVSINGATKYFSTYQISPVTASPSIGTFCHENGHMVCGFPDLYSYGSNGSGVGNFCLMCSHGSTNPQYICPYLRTVAGWIAPRTLPAGPCRVVVSNRLDHVWKYANSGDARQYYLIENRQRSGRDAGIAADGVLIWRCDERGDNTSATYLSGFSGQSSYRRNNEVSLEQADGLYQIERGEGKGDGQDAWFRGNVGTDGLCVFSDTTEPCARWRDGSASGLLLAGFSEIGEVMSFHVGEIPPATYFVEYSLGGGTCGEALPEEMAQGQAYRIPAPMREGHVFAGWTLAGLDAGTAQWGTTPGRTKYVGKATAKCGNGPSGDVYFRDLTSLDGGTVTLFANWTPLADPDAAADVYVSELWGSDSNSGRSWQTAFATLQKAVDTAASGQRIAVYDGLYAPFSVSRPIYLDIRSVNGADRTIVDAALEWDRGVSNRCANFTGSYQTLSGFTLQNGRQANGAGAYNGTLSNCVLRANVATASGGGAYNGVVRRCVFRGNAASWGGGTAFGTQYDSVFMNNVAGTSGGASYSGVLHNCLIRENAAGWGGGCYTGKLWNCTLYRNSAVNYGGGVARSELRNCVVWENASGLGHNYHYSSCLHTCTSPLPPGTGNISADPGFVDVGGGNFHLSSGSPCIDAGSVAYVQVPADHDGNPRTIGAGVDMGAFEAGGSTRTTPLPVPYRWLETFPDALRAAKSDYERTAWQSRRANPHVLWACYALGLDPDDAHADLTAHIDMLPTGPKVTWTPARPSWTPASWYHVEGKSALDDAHWSFPAQPSAHRFFRVTVSPGR